MASHGFRTDGFRHSDAFYNGHKNGVRYQQKLTFGHCITRVVKFPENPSLKWGHDIACGGVYSVLKCIVM